MPANEEPDDGAVFFNPEGSVAIINANGPRGTDTLEVEGGMPVVVQPKLVLLFGAGLNARGQAVELVPKLRRDA